jgi:hypothetical protein
MRDHASAPDPSAILCRRQAQAEETRRVLREMCDAADRAIDDQVSRSSGGAPPKHVQFARLRVIPPNSPSTSQLTAPSKAWT